MLLMQMAKIPKATGLKCGRVVSVKRALKLRAGRINQSHPTTGFGQNVFRPPAARVYQSRRKPTGIFTADVPILTTDPLAENFRDKTPGRVEEFLLDQLPAERETSIRNEAVL